MLPPTPRKRLPWNKGRLARAKLPLRPKHVWSAWMTLQIEGRARDLTMFNLAIGSKLRESNLAHERPLRANSGRYEAACSCRNWCPSPGLRQTPSIQNARDACGKHLPAWEEKAEGINNADVAELVDARDLKCPATPESSYLFLENTVSLLASSRRKEARFGEHFWGASDGPYSRNAACARGVKLLVRSHFLASRRLAARP